VKSHEAQNVVAHDATPLDPVREVAFVGERTPVFFTVHQVAHEWKKTTPTRLMWARPFWDECSHGGLPGQCGSVQHFIEERLLVMLDLGSEPAT